ncbi:flavoprotein [Erysipelothrix urinaevulpis]|uniref:flavoprotein n=1 Tax=Erysipelothrix urinaevulpis TaxID=2683717 RepID=UPI00135AC487|nr:flavoprotein [Erysipelothrix urinaevulpis]
MKTIVIGVTGSIAAYKAADLVSQLKKKGWDVHVVMTASAQQFIPALTLEILSGNKVLVDTFDEEVPNSIYHVEIVKKIDVFLIAPATAHTIAKLRYGLADNMLSNIALVAHQKSKIIAPAMNTQMYLNPLVQENIKALKEQGWQEIEPKESLLACKDVGIGALAEIEDIVKVVEQVKQ